LILTVTLDEFKASLLNKSIYFFKKTPDYLTVAYKGKKWQCYCFTGIWLSK